MHMRVLLDHSAVEIYIGSGEVLSTRVYRSDLEHDRRCQSVSPLIIDTARTLSDGTAACFEACPRAC